MSYQLLHHLSQAPLPVVIYDKALSEQLLVYESKRLIVISVSDSSHRRINVLQSPTEVMKITAAGQSAVRQYLKMSHRDARKEKEGDYLFKASISDNACRETNRLIKLVLSYLDISTPSRS